MPFLSLNEVWRKVADAHPSKKLETFLSESGVSFYPDRRFITGPSVKMIGIGGLPFEKEGDRLLLAGKETSAGTLRYQLKSMIGLGGFMAFLNPSNQSPLEKAEQLSELGHYSAYHGVTFNLLISGVSVAVETDLNCQRDLVHVSKMTTSRTKVQDSPILVVLREENLPHAEKVLNFTESLIESVGREGEREFFNSLFPSLKATSTLMTGSLRNLLKLASLKNDKGKEDEYRLIMSKIEECLLTIFPEEKR